ncbi:serine hydrolase domain-containing protein [Neotamlana sedimentorum]|uniref:serine hydrolase domain-containing protein n=1 Tax=Neotamlana sedimentorum TaxID=1435349 RepID=UPI0013F464B4|nr:serine hydrolase domain-containing protein [Tamlana sedimentorum]
MGCSSENDTSNNILQEDIINVNEAVENFMQTYDVPGASLAVSINEKMVYSKGFGFSNVEMDIPTNKDDVFRIASVTKVFTSTAIMKLIDDGLLSLTDKVFGDDSVLGNDFGTSTFTEDHLNITVDHLLMHEHGGWGVSSGGDPIDYQPQLDTNDFIEYFINNWPLQNVPGQSFSYSNTGYWLLARVIERVSGESFESYIQSMLADSEITSFKITTFREEDREENEVYYYANEAETPYIYNIASRRDGDGGGVISAPDLLRFLCAIDGFYNRDEILSNLSNSIMRQTSSHSSLGRGLGVWESQGLYYFTGSFPGTRTWFIIHNNGKTVVLLLNYRSSLKNFDQDFQNLLLNIVTNDSIPWQTELDQF